MNLRNLAIAGLSIVLVIPVWLLVEYLGEKILGSAFFARKSSSSRVLLAVPIVVALIAIAILLLIGIAKAVDRR